MYLFKQYTYRELAVRRGEGPMGSRMWGGGGGRGRGGRTGALGGIFTVKEEERGREHKITNTKYILNTYIYIYIYRSYTQNKRTYNKVSSPSAMREEDDVVRKTQIKGAKSPFSSNHEQWTVNAFWEFFGQIQFMIK